MQLEPHPLADTFTEMSQGSAFLERQKLTHLEECRSWLYETAPNLPIFDSTDQIGDGERRWSPCYVVEGQVIPITPAERASVAIAVPHSVQERV